MSIKRGDIYLAALDPVIGREIAKTRPVIIVSNNRNNQYGGTVTVLPLTSQRLHTAYPFELVLAQGCAGLPKKSKIKADQIRTLDKKRLIKKIGKLPENQLNLLDNIIKIHLGLF